jgi:ribosomal RNA-processing protein 8
MLGANHFKKKIAKKERKVEAKKQQVGKPPAQQAATPAAPAAPKPKPGVAPAPVSRNRSTLKGPVVAYEYKGSRDSGNDKKQAPFANKRDQEFYERKHPHLLQPKNNSGAGAAGAAKPNTGAPNAAKRDHTADSKSHRRQLRNARNGDDLLDQFRTKLQSSTFRLLNEQIYSSPNAFAGQLLRDPSTFEDYHRGYRLQLVQWPMNPNKVIIDAILGDKRGRFLANKAKSMPGFTPTSWVVCDMGCGDAQIAKALTPKGYKVHSFDFCPPKDAPELVVVADSAHVPLENSSVEICVFSLSLMATDYFDSLLEAFRVLKPKRLLKIVEVRSRIPNPNAFAALVEGIGFTCDWFDVTGDYFIAFDFIKNEGGAHAEANTQPTHHPGDVLLPSLYKKR